MSGSLLIPRRATPSWANGFARSQPESANPNLWTGLQGLWVPGLGPSGGTLYDVSTHSNHGTLSGGATWQVSGQSAISIDNGPEVVDCGTNTLPAADSKSFTVMAFAKRRLSTNYGGLVSKDVATEDREWFFSEYSNSSLRVRVYETDGSYIAHDTANNTFPVGEWCQVGFIVNVEAGTLTAVTNGILGDFTGAWDGTCKNNAVTALRIGQIYNVGSYAFDGWVSSVGIWGRALSPSEIQQLYTDHPAPLRQKNIIFAVSSGGVPPSGFQTYWLSKRHQIIGGGIA